MPMKSFLTRTWSSLGLGTGRSVLYWRTSVPPVFSMRIPFIVVGVWVEDAMARDGGMCWVRRESRDKGVVNRWGSLVRMDREWIGMRLRVDWNLSKDGSREDERGVCIGDWGWRHCRKLGRSGFKRSEGRLMTCQRCVFSLV